MLNLSSSTKQIDIINRDVGPVNVPSFGVPRFFPIDTFPIHAGVNVQYFLSGEEVFLNLKRDIEQATRSIRIITWGFNPLMAMSREGEGIVLEHNAPYPPQHVLKNMLEKKAEEGVEIKIMSWYARAMFLPMFSSSDSVHAATGATPDALLDWMEQLRTKVMTNPNLNIQYQLIDGDMVSKIKPFWNFPTQHQKNVIIDIEEPEKAMAYVMGHNTVPFYWDTREARYHDERRTFILQEEKAGKAYHYKIITADHNRDLDALRDNLHDYSAKLAGPIVKDVYSNFAKIWNNTKGLPPQQKVMRYRDPPEVYYNPFPHPYVDQSQCWYHTQDKPVDELPDDEHYILPPDKANIGQAQYVVTRMTFPDNHRRKIYDTYLQAITRASKFVYFNNQYFRHYDLLEEIIETIATHRKDKLKDIFFFIVTNDFNADMQSVHQGQINKINSLYNERKHAIEYNNQYGVMGIRQDDEEGQAEKKRQLVEIEKSRQEELSQVPNYRDSPYAQGPARGVGNNEGIADTSARGEYLTYQLLEKMRSQYGLRFLWCILKNSHPPHPQIYTHGKLLIVDDVFASSGSANFNQRSLSNKAEDTGDSEANINVYDPTEVKKLRMNSWNMILGEGNWDTINVENISEIYGDIWDIANVNARIFHAGKGENFERGKVVLHQPVDPKEAKRITPNRKVTQNETLPSGRSLT